MVVEIGESSDGAVGDGRSHTANKNQDFGLANGSCSKDLLVSGLSAIDAVDGSPPSLRYDRGIRVGGALR